MVQAAEPNYQNIQINLFEFDTRFKVFPEFIPYDFNHPLRLPGRELFPCLSVSVEGTLTFVGCRSIQGPVQPDNLRPAVLKRRLPDQRWGVLASKSFDSASTPSHL